MRKYRIFLWLLGGEAIAAALYLGLIPGDPKNSVLFGFSLARLVNIAVFLGFGGLLAVLGNAVEKKEWAKKVVISLFENLKFRQVFSWLSAIVSILLLLYFPGWAGGLRQNQAMWQRILPTLILTGCLFLSVNIFVVYLNRVLLPVKREDVDRKRIFVRSLLGLGGIAAALILLCGLTGFGIIPPINRYWNTAGVPVLYSQVLYLVLGFVCLWGVKNLFFPDKLKYQHTVLVFVLLWAGAFFAWEQQDITRSYFVYLPDAPNYEYYPLSDAQRFDLGARFMLSGYGLNNGESEEKPFQMAYLALLHILVGNDYEDLARAQALVMGLVAPLLYLIGKRLVNAELGLMLAGMGILYEINTIAAANMINSANITLLLSEPLTFLGVVMIVYVLIRWLEDVDNLLLGVVLLGMVGAFSYIRANVLILYPTILIFYLAASRSQLKEKLSAFIKASSGFVLVVLPWMGYAFFKYGYLPLFNKFNFVIQNRWSNTQIFSSSSTVKLAQLSAAAGVVNSPGDGLWDTFVLQAAHFMNNLIKSLLIFPASFRIEDLTEVLVQPYWDERILWDGSVGALFYLNLAVVLVGIAFMIARKKMLGVVPLMIGLAYNLASSLATTSGGRYLKPSIWVFIFYYLVGIYFLAAWVLEQARVGRVEWRAAASVQVVNKKTGLGLQLAAGLLLGIGLLVPAADALIPESFPELKKMRIIRMMPDEVTARLGLDDGSLFQLVTDKELNLYYGDALYPRLAANEESFLFAILGPLASMDARYSNLPGQIFIFPNDSEVIAVGCSKMDDDREFDQLVLVYLPEWELVFSVGQDWRSFCDASP